MADKRFLFVTRRGAMKANIVNFRLRKRSQVMLYRPDTVIVRLPEGTDVGKLLGKRVIRRHPNGKVTIRGSVIRVRGSNKRDRVLVRFNKGLPGQARLYPYVEIVE